MYEVNLLLSYYCNNDKDTGGEKKYKKKKWGSLTVKNKQMKKEPINQFLCGDQMVNCQRWCVVAPKLRKKGLFDFVWLVMVIV